MTIEKMTTSTRKATVKKAMKGIGLTDEAVLSGYGNPVGEANTQLAMAIAAKIDNDCMDVLQTATLTYDGSAGIISYAGVVDAGNMLDNSQPQTGAAGGLAPALIHPVEPLKNPRLVFLPIMTILGTLAGSAAVSLILTHRSITDCLAVGSGFGYYSLSSIFITEYKGAELGTIALLANISREILTLLAAPLLVRWFGNLAPISAGGATTMDTTLPIITRTAGQQFVVVSIFHGFVVDFSVPFLVTLFCSI